ALPRCLWLAGRTDDARAVLDDAPAFSLTGTQANDLYLALEPPPPDEPPRELALPHLRAARCWSRAPRPIGSERLAPTSAPSSSTAGAPRLARRSRRSSRPPRRERSGPRAGDR